MFSTNKIILRSQITTFASLSNVQYIGSRALMGRGRGWVLVGLDVSVSGHQSHTPPIAKVFATGVFLNISPSPQKKVSLEGRAFTL
jgi:hypothetical protein